MQRWEKGREENEMLIGLTYLAACRIPSDLNAGFDFGFGVQWQVSDWSQIEFAEPLIGHPLGTKTSLFATRCMKLHRSCEREVKFMI